MTAEAIALALGGGRPRESARGRTWRVRCPSHADGSPSLDITETASGGTLLCCRAGCSQRDVIAALTGMGLWTASRTDTPRATRPEWGTQPMPELPPCCLATPACEHWRPWERDYLVAVLLGSLRDAIGEITARHPGIDAVQLRREIDEAIPYGAIVPAGLDSEITDRIVDEVVETWSGLRAA